MPRPDTLVIDAVTSETRIACVSAGRLLSVSYNRPGDGSRRNDVILARVKDVVPGLKGAFLDIGDDVDAFLPMDRQNGSFSVGQGDAVTVKVRRAAMDGKGARVSLMEQGEPPGGQIPRILMAASDPGSVVQRALENNTSLEVIVDGAGAWNAVRETYAESRLEMPDTVYRHESPVPAFHEMGLDDQVEALLSPVMKLSSGAELHIHETPACVTIDVDSAQATARDSKSENIRRINREAAQAIANAIRLRNLSGNVLIDFIASTNRRDGSVLMDLLRDATAEDTVPVTIRGWTRTGLVEMVRERQGPSLSGYLCVPVPLGDGIGRMRSATTLAYSALRSALVSGRGMPGRPVSIRCPKKVYDLLDRTILTDRDEVSSRLGVPLNLVLEDRMPLDQVEVFTVP